LPEEHSIKIALALAERGLVGQFMGLWPSAKTTDNWIQRNWRPHLKHSVTCYPVGRGFFVFEFISKEDRDLIFRSGPYFMGTQGLYLNRWSPDFDPTVDVPKEVPVWVRLPNLPIHCWNIQALEKIGNTLGRFIDKAEHKGQYSCARICVEVDLEAGLPEAIKLSVGSWSHFQKLDYEQLPFKCRLCHEHGHFQRNCPKAQPEEEGEGWQRVKRGKASSKPNEKRAPSNAHKSDPKAPSKEPAQSQAMIQQPVTAALGASSSVVNAPEATLVIVIRESTPPDLGIPVETQDTQGATSLEPGEIQPEPANPLSGSSPTRGEAEEDSDPGGDTDEGSTESGSPHATPVKNPRGRKPNKKKREEFSYADILQGSQQTLKGMMNTRSKQGQASKGVVPSKSK
jgi:hypothetical protein